MRISELSALSGVSAASIKFYTREELLPAGERIGYNQTDYTAAHLDRLRLIRALIDVGGLSVSSARAVLAAIDDPHVPLPHVFETAQHAIPSPPAPPAAASLARIAEVAAARGWNVTRDNPGFRVAAGVLDAYEAIGRQDLTATLPHYAAAAEAVAVADLDALDESGTREAMAETVVVGTVLGDGLLAGLRRIAQQAETHRRYGAPSQEQS